MVEKKNILIGGAWIYANNSAHIGHISSLITGDILARYHRLKGDNVCYVSGTDCHGTPISISAKKQNVEPRVIANKYHNEFEEVFKKLDFSYDYYGKTDDYFHKNEVKNMFLKLYKNGLIYEKIEKQVYCVECNKFLADREVQVVCSECRRIANGDQCDCGYIPEKEELKDAVCFDCNIKVVERDNKNLYFSISKLQYKIEEYFNNYKNYWRENSINETEKYLKNKLIDRAISRDLTWGIDIPLNGYEFKKLYVWIEAVWGYISATKYIKGEEWVDFWKNNNLSKIYLVHGKDNIVFHSIILPAILIGQNDNYKLPDYIVSGEFITINNEKLSKSKGNGVYIKDLLKKYDSDWIRYYLIKNLPEKKDSNFNYSDFKTVCNADLVNKFSNLVNRTVNFKGLKKINISNCDLNIDKEIKETYINVGKRFEKFEFREGLREINKLINCGNLYYDDRKPWLQFKDDKDEFYKTIFTCIVLIVNLSNLLDPIIPKACRKIRDIFSINKPSWSFINLDKDILLENIEPIFRKSLK